MQSDFYTSVSIQGDNILLRGYSNGKPVKEKVNFSPTLYLPSNTKTKFRTLDGEYVSPLQPGSIRECRDFVGKYKDVSGFRLFGNTDYVYQFIGEHYQEEVEYDYSLLNVATIDIETTCENGFPVIENPTEKIIAITLHTKNKTYCYGLGKYSLGKEEVEEKQYEHEDDLLKDFLADWVAISPDVVTGWNIRFFDIPYLVNRIKTVLGESEAKRLSPWKSLKDKTVFKMNREHKVYELTGISILDYYELYTTFTYVNQESYKLDHIASVELGEKKVSYSEYDNMADFYKKNFQKFMEYNYHDTILVTKLEDKLKLMELAVALAYSAKVNFVDIFSQVRTWDCIIYHYLKKHNIVIPQKEYTEKKDQYAGAYVKEPIVGMHEWIVSFDLNSLYPHLIMHYNISPDTKVDMNFKKFEITPTRILNNECTDAVNLLKEKDYSVAANGCCFTKSHMGFLPALMEKMYEERKMYKKKMIECQKKKQKNKDSKELDYEISKYHNYQLCRKIQLNSAYGAIGNMYFRYYDVDLAEAITLSGQLSIQWIAIKINDYLNTTLETNDYDYIVASDTDSIYLRLDNLVQKVCKNDDKAKIVEFLNKAAEQVIQPIIKKAFEELKDKMNAYQNKMVMEREVIADRGIWTAKKRYMLNVHDSEGVRYDPPKLKIMGIETTRSSTPNIVREKLKKSIDLILTNTEESLMEFISEFKEDFHKCPPEEIAFPRSVNGMDRYFDSATIYIKSTPVAVKGSLIYNHYIKKYNLEKKYPKINEGEKIKFIYLKKPNPLSGISGTDHVVSFVNKIPSEFKLTGYIDYDRQYETSFLEPLKTILDCIGWRVEKTNTLEEFFV